MRIQSTNPIERAILRLNHRHTWVWTLSAILMLLLGLAVALSYITQPSGPELSLFPDPSTRSTLAWALPALILVLSLYLFHQDRKVKDVRAELLRAGLQDESLRAHLSELSSLFEAAVQVQIQPALDLLLDIITQRLLDCLEADRATIALMDSETKELICRQASAANDGNVETSTLASPQGMIGYVFQANEKLLAQRDDILSSFPFEAKRGEKPASALCVPISIHKRVIGAVQLLRLEPKRCFTAREAHMLGILADHLASTIERVEEYTALDRRVGSLDEMNRRLSQLDRLKRGFLAVVNHEARTPVTCILSYADLLLDGPADLDPAKRESYIRIIHDQAVQLREVLNQEIELFCMVAKPQDLRLASTSLNDIVTQSMSTLESEAREKSIDVDVELSPDVPAILCDAQRLPLVIHYLFSRLIRIAPPGERIRIFTGREEYAPGEEGALLGVSYSGSNLRHEALAGAFDPSVLTEEMGSHAFEAFAWGFHLVQDIVELHGGRAWTTREPGLATCFLISLPVRGSSESASEDAAA